MGTKLYKTREKKHAEFGARLQKERKARFKTQQAFADAIGASVESVRNWEQGWILPELGTLFKICDTLDCDIDYLIGRLEYRTHDLKMISDYTGLSENSIEWLHEYHNTKTNANNCIPTYISNIIDHDDFSLLMTRIKLFLGYAFWDGFIGDADFIDTDLGQAAYLWQISQTFTRIIEDLGCKHRNKLGNKDSD